MAYELSPIVDAAIRSFGTGIAIFSANHLLKLQQERKKREDVGKVFSLLSIDQVQILDQIVSDLSDCRKEIQNLVERNRSLQAESKGILPIVILEFPSTGGEARDEDYVSSIVSEHMKTVSLRTRTLSEDELYKQNLSELKVLDGEKFVKLAYYILQVRNIIQELSIFSQFLLGTRCHCLNAEQLTIEFDRLIVRASAVARFGLRSKHQFEALTHEQRNDDERFMTKIQESVQGLKSLPPELERELQALGDIQLPDRDKKV
jgi:hypothetical protein